MSRNHCKACHNQKFGVKTRLPVPHTCGGREVGVIKTFNEGLKRSRPQMPPMLSGEVFEIELRKDEWYD